MKPESPPLVAAPDPLRFLRLALGTGIVLMALLAGPAWKAVAARFGPMTRTESQCLICDRGRVEETFCGLPAEDRISTTECSDWIDTFIPAAHEHVWSVNSTSCRSRWFGSQMIGCGGVPVLSTIFRRREALGEEKCQQLALKFHALVHAKAGFKEFDEFAELVEGNPEHLLNEE